MTTTDEIRRLLAGVRQGDAEEMDRLYALVYDDLRRIARRHLGNRVTGTLGTTAMVNEAYLRLAGPSAGPWQDRAHFLAVASRAMRSILVDHARRRLAQKRGGGALHAEFQEGLHGEDTRVHDILALDQALDRLHEVSDRLARVVELRFFGDLTEIETAEVMGTTERTVRRDWRKARSFLHRELKGDGAS